MILGPQNTLPTGRVSAFILIASICLYSCSSPPNKIKIEALTAMPNKILWAWERPEDLRFIDPKEIGVAFLAQTVFLEKESVLPKPRRQPLEVATGTYMIAVTRVETAKGTFVRPTFDTEMRQKLVTQIKSTLELPEVKAIQIDFDATVSERAFYRSMMKDLRAQMPEGITLTMTALASWCASDTWLADMPVAEAVPMVFQMGADSEKIKNYLKNGNDWAEPLCRGSQGISLEEGRFEGMRSDRRAYFFKNTPWRPDDLRAILSSR